LCLIVGNIIIYFFGIIGLGIFLKEVSFINLLKMGLFPFLIGDTIKIIIAITLFPRLWNKSQKIISNQLN